jgi:GTP-binding protein HflX
LSQKLLQAERAAIVGLVTTASYRFTVEQSLSELIKLVNTAGATVVLSILQERASPDSNTFIGSGKVAALAEAVVDGDIDVVIVDTELTPAQIRQLEARLERKVIDRTQVILDIFASRAKSREGKCQVELAQLQYLLPRLTGSGAQMSRLGGGIGTRGPGETKLETDRRRIRDRIRTMQHEINHVRKRRIQIRERRRKNLIPTVALVGYTNAGKTTLFNYLTEASALASDALFVTLDPLVRKVQLPRGQSFLLSDTVGFIDRLPHTLVAAFRATLEEVSEADLILHVIDASSEDLDGQKSAVKKVLEEVDALNLPFVEVYNKIDLISSEVRHRLQEKASNAIYVSALNGEGITKLQSNLSRLLALDTERIMVTFDNCQYSSEEIAKLYRIGRVISHVAKENSIVIEVDVPRRVFPYLTFPYRTGLQEGTHSR